MAKNQRRQDREKRPKPSSGGFSAPAPAPKPPEAAADGGESFAKARLLWIIAFLLIISGYFFLTKADPGGRNACSWLSPAFLLAGYLLMIPAIVFSYKN